MPEPGGLSWRLSSHPITLLCFLGFRIGMLLPRHTFAPAIDILNSKPSRVHTGSMVYEQLVC